MTVRERSTQPNRHPNERFLSLKYPPEFLEQALIPRERWHPYPQAAEREAWTALPESVRRAHVAKGEKACLEPWPHLPAVVYLQFASSGNRSNFEGHTSAGEPC